MRGWEGGRGDDLDKEGWVWRWGVLHKGTKRGLNQNSIKVFRNPRRSVPESPSHHQLRDADKNRVILRLGGEAGRTSCREARVTVQGPVRKTMQDDPRSTSHSRSRPTSTGPAFVPQSCRMGCMRERCCTLGLLRPAPHGRGGVAPPPLFIEQMPHRKCVKVWVLPPLAHCHLPPVVNTRVHLPVVWTLCPHYSRTPP